MSKNVLVTGGAGFIAHHVIEYLLANTNYNVISLDRLDFSGNLNRLKEIVSEEDKHRVRVVYHDLRAPINQQISDSIGDVDVILHLAAASHVTRSIKYPLEFVESNIIGTVNLLEYARTLKNLERMIYFSTDEVFGPALQGVTFTEHDRYNAANPYSASKAAGEEMCVAYHNTYNIPIYITHTMNVYGERQNPEKYVPMVIKKILNGDEVQIHWNEKTKVIGSRCYLHAKDVADALLFIIALDESKLEYPANSLHGKIRKFNVAASRQYNNLEIYTLIANAIGNMSRYKMVDPNIDRPGHDMSYSISGKYLNDLGWKPSMNVEDRLPEVAKWYQNNQQWLK